LFCPFLRVSWTEYAFIPRWVILRPLWRPVYTCAQTRDLCLGFVKFLYIPAVLVSASRLWSRSSPQIASLDWSLDLLNYFNSSSQRLTQYLIWLPVSLICLINWSTRRCAHINKGKVCSIPSILSFKKGSSLSFGHSWAVPRQPSYSVAPCEVFGKSADLNCWCSRFDA